MDGSINELLRHLVGIKRTGKDKIIAYDTNKKLLDELLAGSGLKGDKGDKGDPGDSSFATLLVGKTLRVDAVNGNNGTAVRGDYTKPYLTIQSAIDSSLEGDTVDVGPGDYNETLTLKHRVPVYFEPEARLIYTGASANPLVQGNLSEDQQYSILGYGQFVNNCSDTSAWGPIYFSLSGANSSLVFEADSIENTLEQSPVFYVTSGTDPLIPSFIEIRNYIKSAKAMAGAGDDSPLVRIDGSGAREGTMNFSAGTIVATNTSDNGIFGGFGFANLKVGTITGDISLFARQSGEVGKEWTGEIGLIECNNLVSTDGSYVVASLVIHNIVDNGISFNNLASGNQTSIFIRNQKWTCLSLTPDTGIVTAPAGSTTSDAEILIEGSQITCTQTTTPSLTLTDKSNITIKNTRIISFATAHPIVKYLLALVGTNYGLRVAGTLGLVSSTATNSVDAATPLTVDPEGSIFSALPVTANITFSSATKLN